MTLTTMAPSSFIRASLMIPVVVAGLWLLRSPMNAQRFALALTPDVPTQTIAYEPVDSTEDTSVDDSAVSPEKDLSPVEARRVRISQLLDTLDQIASVTQQMAPERAATIEPVLVDLAERTLDLSEGKAVEKASTDERLTKLEGTVQKLVRTLNQTVAPEVSL